MNVLVTSHEKAKYERDGGVFKESGKTFDISDKLAYTLGAVLNLRLIGKFRKLVVEKSRYKELESNEVVDFSDGYEFMKSRFSHEIFERPSQQEVLSTKEQVEEFIRLVNTISLDKETLQKWLMNAKAQGPEEMKSDTIDKCISWMKKKMPMEE
jgi:DNA-binding transcriptional regulator YhcF (GntR family)